MEIFTSYKSGEKVEFEDHTDIRKYKDTNYLMWKCSTKNTLNFTGILRTSILKTDLSATTEHDHHVSHSEVNALKAHNKMKQTAKVSSMQICRLQIQLKFMLNVLYSYTNVLDQRIRC